jgi:manganese efflux pump family protein
VLRLLFFVLPLGLDTFAVSAALGLRGLPKRAREEARISRLSTGRGVALLVLGLSVSLDELAIGFTIGLLHLSIWTAVGLIAPQAFLAAQLGLRLGARLGERLREGAERLAGIALLGLGVFFLVERFAS